MKLVAKAIKSLLTRVACNYKQVMTEKKLYLPKESQICRAAIKNSELLLVFSMAAS